MMIKIRCPRAVREKRNRRGKKRKTGIGKVSRRLTR